MNLIKKVSIIIPVHNEEKWIFSCIKSFLNQTYKNIEIVVINDNSIDRTEQIVKKIEGVKLHSFKNSVGEANARSEGVKLSTGEIIIQTDADAIYPIDFVEKAVNILELNQDVSGVSLGEIYVNEKRQGFIADYFRIKRKASFIVKNINKKKSTGCVVFLRSVYDKMGFYDTSLPSGSDVDFSNRMEKEGLKIFWFNDLKMIHADPDSFSFFIKRIWKDGVYSVVFRKKWGIWPSKISLFFIFFRNLIFLLFPFSILFGSIFWIWFFIIIILFLIEGIGPLIFILEYRIILFLTLKRKKIINIILLPLILFIQVRTYAFSKMYAQFNIGKIKKSISFES